MDAACGNAWSRVAVAVEALAWWGGSDRWRSTQGGHIQLAAALLGVGPGQDEGLRQQVANALGVPVLSVFDVAKESAVATTGRARGAAVTEILVQVNLHGAADRLAVCAELCGWRGPAWRWDGHQLRRLPFRLAGTGASLRGG
ncbi:MAG: hypothetical protein WCG26_03075 [Chloroflexales bacterium]